MPGVPLVLPNAWDVATAKAVAAAGFPSNAHCPSVVVVRHVRTLHVADLGRLLVANLATIEAAVAEHGNAVFVIAPSKPIRAMVLPLGLAAEG